uniref:S1-like domain-containing protein n=1 Tax=Peronospora matthiolae TaxID=2874970 RepID=A0AAV1VLX3_9STRA
MSGSGRKSAYRKGVAKRVLYGEPEPKENEVIVCVTALRGSNLFEVVDAHGVKSVTMMPTKFRKLIWIKRGDFLIVGEGDGGEATTATGKKGAVTSIVVHILYKEQIKNLKQKDLWPAEFNTLPTGSTWAQEDAVNVEEEQKDGEDADADEQESQPAVSLDSSKITLVDDRFAQMHVNRNRRKGHFDEEENDDSDED